MCRSNVYTRGKLEVLMVCPNILIDINHGKKFIPSTLRTLSLSERGIGTLYLPSVL